MNTIGTLLRVTSWGESHGSALGVVIDGCPPLLSLTNDVVQNELNKRRPDPEFGGTKRDEYDEVEILSGVFEGKTLGTPIAMLVRNKDVKSEDYENFKNIHRPGHADATYEAKYGIRDWRGGGRASGRETVARVMAGAVARQIIPDIKIESGILQIGTASAGHKVSKPTNEMLKEIDQAISDGDSLGGIIEIKVKNMVAGLGSPVFGKLEAELGKAVLSVGAVKGVEFGAGFRASEMLGSEHNKAETGGILGGISDGTDLVLRVAIKPPSSTAKTVKGRHDVCIVPRLPVVLESMVAIVLADQYLIQKAIKNV